MFIYCFIALHSSWIVVSFGAFCHDLFILASYVPLRVVLCFCSRLPMVLPGVPSEHVVVPVLRGD